MENYADSQRKEKSTDEPVVSGYPHRITCPTSFFCCNVVGTNLSTGLSFLLVETDIEAESNVRWGMMRGRDQGLPEDIVFMIVFQVVNS